MALDSSLLSMTATLWRAFTGAHAEAERTHTAYVGVEGLAAALLVDEGSTAARALSQLGVDAAAVRTAISAIVSAGKGGTDLPAGTGQTEGDVGLPPVERSIELAGETVSPQDRRADTGDMLVALASDSGSIVAGVLASVGFDAEHLRAAAQKVRAASPES